jgi:DNA-binding beta-propeller fold protein YncE
MQVRSIVTGLLVSSLITFVSSTEIRSAEKFDFDYQPDPSFPQWPANVKVGAVSGVGADSKGRVYVLQREKPPVLCFEPSGKFVRSFGDDVVGTGHGLSVDADDNVWVTDTVHHVVFQFSPQGKILKTLGQLDQASEDADKFNKPTYIVFGPKGDLYVMDGYGNARVVHYRDGGRHPEIWGKPGSGPLEFNAPHAGLIDPQGRLVVCDRDNNRIQILHPQTGDLIATWTGYTPFGIAIDRQGTLFVSDAKRQQILQLDSQGHEVRAWGKEGTGPGEFKTPHLIAADRDGNLYAAEVGGRRVQKLKRVSSGR